MTPESPYTRAMPSPTSRTRPTSRTSIWAANCSTSCCMTDAISPLLNFIYALSINESTCREAGRLRFDLLNGPRDHVAAGLFQSCFQRTIEHRIPHADDNAGDQRRIDRDIEQWLAVERSPDSANNFVAYYIIELFGDTDLDVG